MKTIYLFALAISAAGMLVAAPPVRGTTESDKRINDKIFYLLMGDRSLARGSEKLTATTRDGVVTLAGDIRSEAGKEQLHKAIVGTPGVQKVNDSQVIPKPEPGSRFQNDRYPITPKP